MIDKGALAERITKEIAAESGLIAQRSGWHLTFQSFLYAGMTLVPKEKSEESEILISWLPWLGVLISVLILLSIGAAYFQIRYLIKYWEQRYIPETVHPRPFSSKFGHFLGMLVPVMIPVLTAGVWLIVIAN
jgi:hypothetical protein